MYPQDIRGCRAGQGGRLQLTDAPGRYNSHLQVLCESTQRVDTRHKDQHPEIHWASIAGMRNVLVHDYFDVDFQTVWDVITRDLPGLDTAMRVILAEQEQPG